MLVSGSDLRPRASTGLSNRRSRQVLARSKGLDVFDQGRPLLVIKAVTVAMSGV